jgi:hypothetical protein
MRGSTIDSAILWPLGLDDAGLLALVRGDRADADAGDFGAEQGRGAARAPGAGGVKRMNHWPFIIAAYALTALGAHGRERGRAGARCAAAEARADALRK